MPTRSSRHVFRKPGRPLALIALFLLSGIGSLTHAQTYRVVGYISSWPADRSLPVEKIDTLIFAFAHLADGRITLDPAGAARLDTLVGLKTSHPALRIVVSVGGWTAGGFSEAARTVAGRQRFADSAAELLLAHHADGLDVDWEYPGHHESGIASSPQDRDNFTALLAATRAALDRAAQHDGSTKAKHYTLSAAVADGPFVDDVDLAAVDRQLDWFNLMTYDFVNAMTPTTGHHSGLHAGALTPPDARTTDRAVQQFLAAGVAPGKLLIGAAFYGREFAEVKPSHDGLYQPYGHYQGGHDWPELKRDFIGHNGYARHWDAQAQAPWLWNARTHRFISYDDPRSLRAKAAYVQTNHLGGIMYWEQGQDPQGELLDVLWQALHASSTDTDR